MSMYLITLLTKIGGYFKYEAIKKKNKHLILFLLHNFLWLVVWFSNLFLFNETKIKRFFFLNIL